MKLRFGVSYAVPVLVPDILLAIKETLRYGLFLGTYAGTFVSVDELIAAIGGHHSCYLALGEADIASVHFMKCLQAGNGASLDTKHSAEASEGLNKAKKILECMKQSSDLLQQGTAVYAEHALVRIEEALTISSFSEKLQEMKADVLFMVCYHNDHAYKVYFKVYLEVVRVVNLWWFYIDV